MLLHQTLTTSDPSLLPFVSSLSLELIFGSWITEEGGHFGKYRDIPRTEPALPLKREHALKTSFKSACLSSVSGPPILLFFLLFFLGRFPAESRFHHVFGVLWEREQLVSLQCRRGRSEQRLFPGCSQRGPTCFSSLHHLSHSLHR